MDERITDHLQRLNQYLVQLKEISQKSKAEFISDPIIVSATERYLQLAIESCINIGNRIISLEQFRKNINIPESYADIFIELGKAGIFSEAFAKKLVKMAKFRNRLVHIYWDLQPGDIHQILQENLADFEAFIKAIVHYHKNME